MPHDQPHSGTAVVTSDFRVSPGAEYGAGGTRAEKGPQVSKSDQQLFGELAGVVRQLGVAASAAADARTLMRERANQLADLQKCLPSREQAETGELNRDLLTQLWEFEDHAARIHRHVAEVALRDHAQFGSGQTNMIGDVLELNWGTLAAALKPHPLRPFGLTVAVAENLRDRIAAIWTSMAQARDVAEEKNDQDAEVLVIGRWNWTVDAELPFGRWDIRSN